MTILLLFEMNKLEKKIAGRKFLTEMIQLDESELLARVLIHRVKAVDSPKWFISATVWLVPLYVLHINKDCQPPQCCALPPPTPQHQPASNWWENHNHYCHLLPAGKVADWGVDCLSHSRLPAMRAGTKQTQREREEWQYWGLSGCPTRVGWSEGRNQQCVEVLSVWGTLSVL